MFKYSRVINFVLIQRKYFSPMYRVFHSCLFFSIELNDFYSVATHRYIKKGIQKFFFTLKLGKFANLIAFFKNSLKKLRVF